MLYYNSVLKLIRFSMFSCPHAGRPRRPRHTGKLGSDSWVARGGRPRMPRQGYTVPYKKMITIQYLFAPQSVKDLIWGNPPQVQVSSYTHIRLNILLLH